MSSIMSGFTHVVFTRQNPQVGCHVPADGGAMMIEPRRREKWKGKPMTDAEIGDRLLEMREQTARRCAEIVLEYLPTGSYQAVLAGIAKTIKKEFDIED